MKFWPWKDPDENLDYEIDWTARLAAGDEIASVTWVVPDGLVKGVDDRMGAIVRVWLSGGTSETTYEIVCRITTALGRVHEVTRGLYVVDGGEPG